MMSRVRPAWMSEEQFEEAQRLFEVTEDAMAEERWRMCCLMASKPGDQLLGQTEFEKNAHTGTHTRTHTRGHMSLVRLLSLQIPSTLCA